MCRFLMLQWTEEILIQSQAYLASLQKNDEFLNLIQAIVAAGHTLDMQAVVVVCQNLKLLLSFKEVSLKVLFFYCAFKCVLYYAFFFKKIRYIL